MHTRTSLNPACCRWLIVVAGILLGSLASSRSALATASFEEQVVELINDERAALDLPPLIMDNRLYNAAEHHADWMATHEILDHTEDPPTPPHEYDEPKQRAITYGYCSEMSITALGEAIGMGHTTPEEIVEDWMGSPGHYMVIMSSSGRHIGSGYVYDGSKTYKHYWSVTVARCSTDPEPLARTIGADAQGVQALATADLDGDGDVDVVAAEYDHNKVAWYANSGDATPSWTKHDIGESGGTVANGARSVHAADIDGDGDIDVLAALETDDKVMLYENQGNAPPTWVNVTIDSAAYNARAVFAADADDDGDLDVVASYYNDTLPGGYIKFYENDGSWTKHQIFYSTDFDGQSLFAADIDRDGYPDVLSASTSATEEVVRVLVNNGSWGFTEYVVNSDLGSAPQWVTAADIDQDGILDVLSARYGDDKVAWHKTSIVGSSLSWTLNALTPTADGARCVSVADIDSDGDPDVLVASELDDDVVWHVNDGSSTNWPATKISSVAAGAVASAIADIDGDGDLDFVSASDGDDHIRWYRHRKIHRSAKFAPAATVGSFGGPSSATVADMDGDGLLDVVGAAVNDDMVVWWESQLDSGSCPPTCWSEHLVDDSLDSNSVAAADLDGDGDDDLVTAAFYHGKVTWWQNDGPCTGTGGACSWPAGTIAGSLPSAWAVHAADINSDGDIDVLGTAVNTDNGVADVVYWENDGYWTGNTFNASWTMVTLETSFNGARGVHAADIDGDGDLDVIAASSADDTIKWWENLGGSSPSWDDHTVDSTFDGAWDVHAADLNGDTFVDIIGVAYDGTSLTWWENSNGAGIAWYDHPVTNAFLGAWSVSAADLDADGDTDVLGVAEGMNTVSWFANTGDCGGDGVPCSSWITDTLSSAASAPMSAVPADIDRDGKPDVIAALRGDGDVVWWENRGGEFALPTTNTSPENGLTNQAPEDLLKIEAHHRGVAGDVDIELESFELLFEEAEDDPLTTLEANAIISETYIYLDDGSGAFEAASDTLVVQIDDLALDENGVQSVQFSDNESDVRVQQGSPRTYFVVVWLTDADPLPDPNMFRVTHLTESSSTGANRETDEDVELEYAQNTTSRTVPVTLSYFLAQPLGADVEFEWGTLTEVGNVGFNLYEKRSGEWRRINEILIGTAGYDSLTPLEYTYRASGVAGTEFVIEDVDSLGSRTRHGPFRLGEFHGSKPEVDPIDWPSIRAEQEVRARARIGESLIEVQHELDANAGGLTAAHRALETGLPLGPSGGASSANTGSRAAADGVRQGETLRPVELWVSETGLHRVRYEDLVAAGIDVGRLPLSSAQITHRGRPVPIRLSPTKHDQAKFGPETYVEFYGQAADSLYTSTSVYVLEFVPGGGARVITERKPFQDGEANAIYVAQEVEEDDREYSFGAPNGDPWYAKTLLAFDKEVAWTQTVEVSDLADGALPATLDVGLWGVTNFPSSPDHHIVVEVNGQRVADEWFDGLVDHPVSVELPPRVMREGENVVRISAPGDTGAQWDMTAIDHVSVEYPRRTVAREGALTFEAAGPVIRVDGLPSDDIVVYRHPYPRPVHVTGVRIAETSSGFSAEFNGPAWPAAYTVAAAPAVLKPSIVPARQTDLTFDEPADYVVIAHPSFLFGVQPLVKARREQGYQVRVVDVEDLYAHYTGGEIDPQAIGDYIAESHRRSGTRYVLLVGGDTYDYHDNLGLGSVSFIPSIYAQTGPIVRYAPADPKYGDVDGDGVPEVAIGRFPVRTTEELASLVDKTLVYGRKDYGRTALFAADAVDPAVSFTDDSELFVSELPAGWRVSRAYLDRSEVGEARDVLLSAVNDGVSLTSFIGHSGLTAWTFDGLFSAADAAKLTNSGRPTVAVQWGCWNNYHVAPQYNTMGHKLLLAGDKGAAAVLGAATLTRASSDQALGQLVSPLIAAEGVTIGDAVLTAKTELAQTLPDLTDVLLGWTLLGDPTLVVEPAGQ